MTKKSFHQKNMKKERKIVAIIPYNEQKQILLVTSRKYPDQWLLPKGGVDDGENDKQAAEREGWEEGGVRGEIGYDLGIFEGQKIKKNKVQVYQFHIFSFKVNELVHEMDWIEAKERQRKWFDLEESLEKVKYSGMKEAILEFKNKNGW